MAHDKYKMFKNFLHNELGVSQDDIRQWLKESCEETAKKMVEKEFDNFSVPNVVSRAITQSGYFGTKIKDEIMRETAKQLIEKFDIRIDIRIKN